MNKKNNFKILIIVALTVLVFLYLIIFNIKKNTKVEVQAEISKLGTNYVIVIDQDNNEYLINTSEQYNIGDKVSVIFKNLKKGNPYTGEIIKIDTLSRNVAFSITDTPSESGSDDVIGDISNDVNENTSNDVIEDTGVSNETKDETIVDNVIKDEQQVIAYFANFSNEIDNTSNFKGEIKEKFVTIVDFLFYDGVIGEVSFDELTNSAKLKILELMLKIDEKLENKFPGYKETISENSNKVYNNVKDKVISLYFDITASVCADNGELCDDAKKGLGELKKSFSLTWDFIKKAAGSGLGKLKSWYEIWREI